MLTVMTHAPSGVEGVDAAVNILGNTRAVTHSSYAYLGILQVYGTKNSAKYYNVTKQKRATKGLDSRETVLKAFLE